MRKSKILLAWLSFVSGIVIGFIALFLPPQGIIDDRMNTMRRLEVLKCLRY